MKKILVILFVAILITGCGSSVMEISNSDALEVINKEKNILILDVRTEEEYNISHIEGAILIPHTELKEIENLIKSNDYSKILVYCRSGNRSSIVSEYLVDKGYSNIYNMSEGFANWNN